LLLPLIARVEARHFVLLFTFFAAFVQLNDLMIHDDIDEHLHDNDYELRFTKHKKGTP
jgi:hypothetical protein